MSAAEAHSFQPNSIGQKFNENGNVLPFRGNTVVCHIPEDSGLFQVMSKIALDLKASPLARCYSFLPSASYHMTVFNGANDSMRTSPNWPAQLSPSASMDECDAFVAARLSRFDLDLKLPIRMRVSGLTFQDGASIRLAPIDADEDRKLRRLRARLKEALQCERGNQETYEFHASISYLIKRPTDQEVVALQVMRAQYVELLMRRAAIIELSAPEFCVFEDMHAYRRQFYLSEGVPHAA